MRSFRQLTKAQISEIVAAHHGGETQTSLAARFGVDRSTIHYHLDRYERAYPELGDVYAVIKVDIRKRCVHPSGRCVYCGELWDGLMRAERDLIRKLTKDLETARSRLRTAGLPVE